jgi:hypothetical protein
MMLMMMMMPMVKILGNPYPKPLLPFSAGSLFIKFCNFLWGYEKIQDGFLTN